MADDIIKRLIEEEEKVFSKETQREALISLKSWLEENSDTIKCRSDEKFLHAFLRMREYNVKEAKKMITNFSNCCKAVPKYTSNLDFYEEKLNYVASSGVMYSSHVKDDLGRRVIVVTVSALDTALINHVDLGRYVFAQLFMLCDRPESQLLGYVYILDFGNITPSHATFWPLWDLIHLTKFGMKSVTMRHKEIHVINMNSIIRFLFYMATSVLSAKLKKRITIHNTLEDLQSMISRKVLPLEYGGSIPASVMCDLWKRHLIEHRELIMSMQNLW